MSESESFKMSIDPQKQRTWQCVSKVNHSGYFLWEIVEVMGVITPQTYFTTCIDETYVYISCLHFFTKEALDDYLGSDIWSEFREYIKV